MSRGANVAVQFLALCRHRADRCCVADLQRRLEAESGLVEDLREAGLIRQIWRRGDAPGACLLIEAQNEESARAVLEMSAMIRSGLLQIDAIVPLMPYESMGASAQAAGYVAPRAAASGAGTPPVPEAATG